MSGTDKSTLEISVITTGLNGNGGAPAQLNKLGEAAGKAEPKVQKLLDTIEKLMKQQQSATATAQAYTQAINGSIQSMGGGGQSAGSMATATKKLAAAMTELASAMTSVQTRNQAAEKSFFGLSSGMKDAQAASRGLAGSLGALWTTYGNAIPLAAGLAIGSSMKAIVSIGKDVENTLEGIRVRSDESIGSIDKMRESILSIGKGVYGPQEVAKAFETLVLAGQSAGQALQSINAVLNLATVGGTSIEKAATTLVQVGTALGYSAEGFDRVGDVIAKTAAASMSSVESLSEAFKSASAVGKLYGASLEDIGTALGALSQLGIQGSAAGTSLKNFYSELAKESKKLKDVLGAMHLVPADLKDAQGNFLDMVTVVTKLSAGLDHLTPAAQKQAMAMMANERGMKTVVELLDLFRQKTEDGSNELSKFHEKVADSFGYAAIGAAQMALTVDAQFKSVKNTLQSTFAETFKSIEPQLLVFSNRLKSAFGSAEFKGGVETIALALADLAVKFAQNIPQITLFVEGFLAFKGVMFVVETITAIATAIKALEVALIAGGVAAKAFQISLGLLGGVLLVAGAAWAYYHNMKDQGATKEEAALTNLDEYNTKLAAEAERLRKVNEQLALGRTLKQAEAQTTAETAIAMAEQNKQTAIAAAQAKVDEAESNLKNHKPSNMAVDDFGRPMVDQAKELKTALAVAQNQLRATSERANALTNDIKGNIEAVQAQSRVQDAYLKDQIKAQQEAATRGAGTGTLPGKPAKDDGTAALMKKEDDEFARRIESLTVATAQQQEMLRGMKELGSEYEKLGVGQKTVMKIEYELALLGNTSLDQIDKKRQGYLLLELAAAKRLATAEAETNFEKAKIASGEALQKDTDARIASINKEAEATELKVAAYGELKGTTDLMMAQDLEVQKQAYIDAGITGKVIDDLNREIDARQRLANAKGNLAVEEKNKKGMADLDKFLNPKKALDFGTAMEQSFGKAGKAIDGMAKAFDRYSDQQAKNEKFRKAANDLKDEKQRAKVLSQIDEEATKDRVAYYGDTAAAAKGFFKENSKGYLAMEAAEKSFRLIEMALALKSFITKTFFTTAVATTNEEANAEMLISEETSTAETIRLAMMSAQAKAGEAVTNQGGGDPYSAFFRIAAMAGVMAAMGFAVSGASGAAGAGAEAMKKRQETQGTGTVFGDDTAKSTSIVKALDFVKENTADELGYSSKMLKALQGIESSMNGLANIVIRTSGLTTGKNFGVQEGVISVNKGDPILGMFGLDDFTSKLPLIGGIISKLQSLWGKTTQTVTDSGLMVNGSLGQLSQGQGVQQYADVEQTKSSWFGLSKSTSMNTQMQAIGDEVQRQFGKVFANVRDSLATAGSILGQGGDNLVARLNEMQINLDKVSLKDLKGQDLTDALNNVVSAAADNVANTTIRNMEPFKRIGEGAFETVMRVASGVEEATHQLRKLGVGVVDYSQILNKQGDVTTELIRQSLMQSEGVRQMFYGFQGWVEGIGALSGIGQIISEMDGSAQDLIDTYKQLVSVRADMKYLGLGSNLNGAMVQGADGIDNLASSLSDFMDGMFNDSEKLAINTAKLKDGFGKLGIAVPASTQAFRELVQQVAGRGDMGLTAKLLALSSLFSDVTTATEDLAKSQKDAADAAAEAAKQAADDAAQAKEDALSKAHDTLSAAYDKEKAALDATQSKFEDFAKSLRSFRDGLMTGASSPGTPGDKYATASARYASTMALAQSGNKDAMDSVQSVAQEFLTLSREYNASGDAYTADFNRVMTESGLLADYADQQVDVAKASLDALEKQVSGLMEVKDSVVSVQVAVMQLYDVLTKYQDSSKYGTLASSMMQQYAGQIDPASLSMYTNMISGGASYQAVADAIKSAYPMDGSHANGLGYVPFNGYRAELHQGEAVLTASENKAYQMGLSNKGSSDAVVQELQGLRQEVQQLKEEQRQQTQALIGSNYDAHESAACKVVDGVGDALSQSARVDQVRPALN